MRKSSVEKRNAKHEEEAEKRPIVVRLESSFTPLVKK